jgi:hypothetical protein
MTPNFVVRWYLKRRIRKLEKEEREIESQLAELDHVQRLWESASADVEEALTRGKGTNVVGVVPRHARVRKPE